MIICLYFVLYTLVHNDKPEKSVMTSVENDVTVGYSEMMYVVLALL